MSSYLEDTTIGYVQGGTRPAGECPEVGGTRWMDSGFLWPKGLAAAQAGVFVGSRGRLVMMRAPRL
jgi:hypothetical protein